MSDMHPKTMISYSARTLKILRETNEETEQVHQFVRKKFEECEKQKERLEQEKEEILDLKNRIGIQQKEKEKIENNLENARQDFQKMSLEIRDIGEELQEKENSIQIKNQELNDRKKILDIKMQNLQNLTDEYYSVNCEIHKSRNALKRKNDAYRKKSEELEMLTNAWDTNNFEDEKAKLDDKIAEVKRKIEIQDEVLKKKQRELAGKNDELKEIKEKIAAADRTFEQSCQRLEEEKVQFQNMIFEQNKTILAMEEEKKEIYLQLEEKKKTYAELKSNVDLQKNELESFSSDIYKNRFECLADNLEMMRSLKEELYRDISVLNCDSEMEDIRALSNALDNVAEEFFSLQTCYMRIVDIMNNQGEY